MRSDATNGRTKYFRNINNWLLKTLRKKNQPLFCIYKPLYAKENQLKVNYCTGMMLNYSAFQFFFYYYLCFSARTSLLPYITVSTLSHFLSLRISWAFSHRKTFNSYNVFNMPWTIICFKSLIKKTLFTFVLYGDQVFSLMWTTGYWHPHMRGSTNQNKNKKV